MPEIRGKVLLVDDDPEDLQYYRLILGACGYDVLPCGSYADSSFLLAQDDFDCLVVSQGSRGFEGKVVLERLVERDRYLPVLVLARCLHMGSYLDAMQLGAVDYLEKPVTREQIQWVMDTHVRRRSVAA